MFYTSMYLGRAPRTKETLPDFREKCRVTRHSRVFRGLTGSQWTPGFGASQSLQKSSIAFSRDVKEETAKRISIAAKIPITTNLGKYLGIPSITGRLHLGLFQHIVDRVDGRLDGWKFKLLSLAERIVLAQTVLTTIPMYPMQSSLLPISLSNTIDKNVRQFI